MTMALVDRPRTRRQARDTQVLVGTFLAKYIVSSSMLSLLVSLHVFVSSMLLLSVESCRQATLFDSARPLAYIQAAP